MLYVERVKYRNGPAGFFALLSLLLLGSCRSGPSPEPEPEAPLETGRLEAEETAEETDEPDAWGEILLSPAEGLPVSAFPEIWAYVVAGREAAFNPALPLSDIAYFGAEVDSYGHLADIPNRRNLRAFKGKVHLAAACNSRGLTHFVLREETRRELVAEFLEAAKAFDGVQIDFELVPARDGAAFRAFLRELRAGLGDKMLTIALPARTRTLAEDVYGYGDIKDLVDRVLVMAYDEHWSTSEPGPIASLGWCRGVAAYSLSVLGPEKLIMGLPFYGRAWGDLNPSQAYVFSGIERIKNENRVGEVRRENGIPTFKYEQTVKVTAYYEDAYSLAARLDLYRSMGVKSVGFWRLGQEDPAVWGQIVLSKTEGGE
jgi:spore germination protein YaaH